MGLLKAGSGCKPWHIANCIHMGISKIFNYYLTLMRRIFKSIQLKCYEIITKFPCDKLANCPKYLLASPTTFWGRRVAPAALRSQKGQNRFRKWMKKWVTTLRCVCLKLIENRFWIDLYLYFQKVREMRETLCGKRIQSWRRIQVNIDMETNIRVWKCCPNPLHCIHDT